MNTNLSFLNSPRPHQGSLAMPALRRSPGRRAPMPHRSSTITRTVRTSASGHRSILHSEVTVDVALVHRLVGDRRVPFALVRVSGFRIEVARVGDAGARYVYRARAFSRTRALRIHTRGSGPPGGPFPGADASERTSLTSPQGSAAGRTL